MILKGSCKNYVIWYTFYDGSFRKTDFICRLFVFLCSRIDFAFIFSYGIIGFALDFIQISPEARFRKLVLIYSAVALVFAICLIFVPMIEHPSVLLNILGIWIPTAVSVLLGLIFCKRVNTGIFRKEKWLIIVLSIVNLALLDGKSNKELAETFFVTQKTIEAHLANIYRKVGVKNRLELFARLQNK